MIYLDLEDENKYILENQHFLWCSSNLEISSLDQKFVSYVNVLVSLFFSIYTSLKTSSESKSLGINANKSEVNKLFLNNLIFNLRPIFM
jgi:hypothetical protein